MNLSDFQRNLLTPALPRLSSSRPFSQLILITCKWMTLQKCVVYQKAVQTVEGDAPNYLKHRLYLPQTFVQDVCVRQLLTICIRHNQT